VREMNEMKIKFAHFPMLNSEWTKEGGGGAMEEERKGNIKATEANSIYLRNSSSAIKSDIRNGFSFRPRRRKRRLAALRCDVKCGEANLNFFLSALAASTSHTDGRRP
jgi:hypothetical protein